MTKVVHLVRLAPLVLVLAVGGLAACAGSESDFLSDPPRSTASAPRIAPLVPDTPVATPAAIAPTEPITLPEPSTTPPAPAPTEPATTVPAGPPTEAEVRAALDRLFAAWNLCQAEPATCEPEYFAGVDSPMAISLQAGSQEWAAAGKYYEPRVESNFTVEKIVVLAPDLLKVTVCDVDYGWIREVNGTPEHDDDTVLDDRAKAFRSDVTLKGTRGDELLYDYFRLQVWTRETACPAA